MVITANLRVIQRSNFDSNQRFVQRKSPPQNSLVSAYFSMRFVHSSVISFLTCLKYSSETSPPHSGGCVFLTSSSALALAAAAFSSALALAAAASSSALALAATARASASAARLAVYSGLSG